MEKKKFTVRDRNLISYLITLGHPCEFVPQAGGVIEAEFEHSDQIKEATLAYMGNCSVAIQSFVSASKYVSDRIRQARQAVGA